MSGRAGTGRAAGVLSLADPPAPELSRRRSGATPRSRNVHAELVRRAGTRERRSVSGPSGSRPAIPARLSRRRTRHAMPRRRTGLRRHDGAHLGRQRRRIVEQPQRREMIAPAGVVAPALACSDQDAVFRTHGALRHLDVDGVMMQRDFAAHSDSGDVGSQIVVFRRKAEILRQRAATAARAAV